jgi:mRNA-degrading endonuclease RelE of RelBE toxin-antitoxin system
LRVRVGNYRVVIQVLEFVVFIVEINDRKDSYK